jgi:hypothetical protein
MKISDTSELLKFVETSDLLVLKIGMGQHEKAIWCPSFKAQYSHSTQAISDSIWETFAFVDCHFRNLNSVSDVESDYVASHIYIGTTKSIEQSNISPDFIEKLAKIMSDKWEKLWNRQKFEEMEYDIQYKYGSDCYYQHLFPSPHDMKSIEGDLFAGGLGMP